MKIKLFLFCAALLLPVIFLSGKSFLYYYWGALVITVSYLNSRPSFLQERFKWYNTFFFVYLLFVVWERTRTYQFSSSLELGINNLEHIFFGVLICTLASLVLKLPPFTIHSLRIRLLLSALIFNGIGFINEWFQNSLFHRPVFTLIPDSLKDLRMNVWGTLIFVLLSLVLYRYNDKQVSYLNSPIGKN